MSCLLSCFTGGVRPLPPLTRESGLCLDSIFLTQRQIRDFYAVFCHVDRRGNVATTAELLEFLNVEKSMFSKRLRLAVAEEITFVEFVLSVWNYCTADVCTMNDMCFRMYLPRSLDYEDEIHGSDMKKMLEDLYGDNYLLRHPKLQAVHDKLTALNDVPFNLEHFISFCQLHELLIPAFEIQSRLCTILLGQEFWAQAVKKRKLLEHNFAFKNNFELEHRYTERYLDLPRKPSAGIAATSVQNHSRGSETLTAKARRDSDADSGCTARSDCSSLGDHPSLRSRRRSMEVEDFREIDRTTKLEFQKNMEPTEHEMAMYRKDVLSVGVRERGVARRRHSDGGRVGGARVAPANDAAADKMDASGARNSARPPTNRRLRRQSRRLTY